MKPKLKIFREFGDGILPHEALYLKDKAGFQDEEKIGIFEKLIHNALHPEHLLDYDEALDKRKYNYIKNWVLKTLDALDVDKKGAWLLEFKRKLSLDLISAAEEAELFRYLKQYKRITYNFADLYDLLKDYRSYLLIRLRYEDHRLVLGFLEKYESSFQKSLDIREKLYRATRDITEYYTSPEGEHVYWERWLYKVFSTETIDGKNRYRAFILLAFLYNSRQDTEKLRTVFDDIDGFFAKGEMYCRRLLYNYYSSRVLLYSKTNQLKKAVYFAELSIRQDNEDTLMYVNNLLAIYLKMDRTTSAFDLLAKYEPYFKASHNDYQRVTFMSYRIRVLLRLGKLSEAENLGYHYLRRYENDILKYRWHHFFTSLTEVLLSAEKYEELLTLERKYELTEREKHRIQKRKDVPNLAWILLLAGYMENKISQDELRRTIRKNLGERNPLGNKDSFFKDVVQRLTKAVPDLQDLFKSYL